MIGTILNAAGILAGGAAGLARLSFLTSARELQVRVILAAFTVYYALLLVWRSVNGSALQVFKQGVIVLLALSLGKLIGGLLRLQKGSNRLGGLARDRIAAAGSGAPGAAFEGFKACSILFCAAPLGILGAVHDGLAGYAYPLGVMAVMDGLAAMGFARMFGWGAMLAAVPVFILQGTISLLCSHYLKPYLDSYGPVLADSINATGGMLVFCVALVMLELKKIHLADYLPSLVVAPLLSWVWR